MLIEVDNRPTVVEITGPFWVGHFPFGKNVGFHFEYFVSVEGVEGAICISRPGMVRRFHVKNETGTDSFGAVIFPRYRSLKLAVYRAIDLLMIPATERVGDNCRCT